ncbi:MAG: M28 family peptidase [Sphingobacteriales bacterium]|nr:M28 family peptidase [Sphingobacteriales bacterium]
MFKALTFLALLMLAACGGGGQSGKTAQTTQQTAEQPKAYKQVSPNFNADSAYYFVDKQVSFGPRVTNSEPHKKCGDWLVAELRKMSDNVIEQKTTLTNYDGRQLNIRNIIAEINPKADKRILLCAHWDSRPFADEDTKDTNKPILGANDGGSGVGVLMEIARIIKNNPLSVGIDIVLFDAEDLGKSEHNNSYCLGSQYWSTNLHKPGYKAEYGILLDMVGAANAKFAWEEVSVTYARLVLEKVWGTAQVLGYPHFVYYNKGGIIDDHAYVNKNAGIPTIDIIHFDTQTQSGFPEHWHTHRDNMYAIDRTTLKAVGQTLLEVIYSEKF